MLIRFYVENFSSFRTRQSFSMIPGKGTLKSNHKTTPVKGISVLKAAVVFGANASGKSNLIKAINFGKKLVLEDIKPGQKIDYSKFRLNELSIAGNSRLEYELQHNGKNYAYGFVFNKDGIVEEWLYEVTKKSDKKIFVRNGSSFDLSYLISINKRKEEKQFINFIAKGTPDNKLFLNEIRHRKVKENVTDISDITNVLDWFLNSLKVILPEDKYNVGLRFELKDDEKLLKSFEQFLEYFDTGIDGVCLEPISVEKVDIPDFLLKRISDDLLNANSKEKRAAILSDNNTTYFISIINNEVGYHKFMTKHIIDSGKEVLFDTSEESDGTNRIIDFIPLLMDLLQGDNVFIIDEMERSLHPNLIYDLIDLFLAKSINVNSQMILASHESSLLTQKLLRKDEIWFTVKETDGSTTIHSLEEYNIRFDKKIRKDYLLGRFKAIPKLGNRNNLTVLPNQ
ncbi:MAG: ATP-binding protein [Lewinellaceae bacterium]|nr:ATP-binding protein [Lewinellaceae bacterium]